MKTYFYYFFVLVCFMCYSLFGQTTRDEYRFLRSSTTGEYIEVYKQSWALIIGIDKYQHVNRLDYAVADARAIKNLLITKFGFEENKIRLITDNEATKDNIEEAFNNLRKVGSADRVIIFIACHGQTVDLPSGGEMGYIIPVNGKPGSDGLFLTCIPMSTIKQVSDLIPAKHVLFLIDACYGGLAATITHSALDPSEVDYINKVSRNRARQIITAGGRGEKVLEKSEWGHSAFTKKLLEGLGDNAADLDNNNVVYASELAMYLQKRVSIMTNNRQTPKFRYLSDDEGEFMFILPSIGTPIVAETRYGEIMIDSYPEDGAEIFIDGQSINSRTPAQLSKIESGIHTIELKKGIYVARQTFTVIPNKKTELMLKLEIGNAVINISSDPSSADVYLDGSLIGKTPINPDIMAGTHKVKITKSGYLPDSSEVTLLVKENKPVYLSLRKACSIKITSDPGNAEVYLNDRKLLYHSPLTIPDLVPGEYRIKIKYSSDYGEWDQTVTLLEGEEKEISANLPYKYGFLNVQQHPANVEAFIDGRRIAFDSLSSCKVLTGSHIVEFKDPSTQRSQSIKINAEPKSVQSIDVKFNVFSATPLFRSMIIPGWGQWNSGSKLKGTAFFLGTGGALAFFIIEMAEFNKQKDDYNLSKDAYTNAQTIDDALYWGDRMRNEYSDVERVDKIKNIALVTASVLYGLNIADVLISHSHEDEISLVPGMSQTSIIPEIRSVPNGVSMGFKIIF